MTATGRTPEQVAQGRRVAGFALLAGAVGMGAAAALIYAGTIPVGDDVRGLLAGVLAAVAGLDIVIGIRFLLSSQQ